MTEARQKAEESRTLLEIWERFEGTFSFGKPELALCKAYEDAIRSCDLELEKYRWIPCSERLPEIIEHWGPNDIYGGSAAILYVTKERFYGSGRYYQSGNWATLEGEKIHDEVERWMAFPALPEAPKEGL